MAGTLSQHRPVSIPTGNQKFDEHEGEYVWRRVLKPSGFNVNGRPREYTVRFEPVMEHILHPVIEPNRPGKHSRGRIKPRTAAQKAHVRRLTAQMVQFQKRATLDYPHAYEDIHGRA